MKDVDSNHYWLDEIPFLNEKIRDINFNTDFIQFVDWYTICFGENESVLFKKYIKQSGIFILSNNIFKQNFEKIHPFIIGSLKHSFVFERITQGLAGRDEVNVFGLPYLIESNFDIECALFLLKSEKYKQSNQILRSALETVVTHAYLSFIGVLYDDIINLKIPPFRSEMLNSLLQSSILNAFEYQFISKIYWELCKAIHSEYKYLNVKFEEALEKKYFLRTLKNIKDTSISCLFVLLNLYRIGIN